jgi:predicted phage gp36 major capsid-like protein
MRRTSTTAARYDAQSKFEAFRAENTNLKAQEKARVLRMYDSREGLVNDRIQHNTRQIAHLRELTSQQQRIVPALEGQIKADHARLGEMTRERQERLDGLDTTMAEQTLKCLGATLIVRPGALEAMQQ